MSLRWLMLAGLVLFSPAAARLCAVKTTTEALWF